jgi:hypothetical protein
MASKFLVATTAVVLVAGCANSGPVPIGRDTYMVTNTGAWAWSSGADLLADSYRQAAATCAAQGKEVQPINSQSNDSRMGLDAPFAHGTLYFRCLSSADPEAGRPNLKPTPNVVIETR